jgi:hypothetical protein
MWLPWRDGLGLPTALSSCIARRCRGGGGRCLWSNDTSCRCLVVCFAHLNGLSADVSFARQKRLILP